MNENKALARETRKKTLQTLRELDEHIMLLDYHCDYDLPGMLAAGKKSAIGLARFLQKQIRSPRLAANPLCGHGGCSTFNVRTPEGKVIMGRNFDFKDARCLVVWTHPENGYRSMAVCNQNLMMYADVRRSRRGLRALGSHNRISIITKSRKASR